MNKILLLKLLPLLVFLNSIISQNQWSKIPLGYTIIEWLINFSLVFLVIWYKQYFFNPRNKKDYTILSIYFTWMIFGVIRGAFIAENYWEYKQLITGTLALSLPLFVYIFSNPFALGFVLNKWLKYGVPAFFVFFIWVLPKGAYHFYLGPILLLSCFLPLLRKNWQILFIILLLLMVFSDWGARSQVIKAFAALLMTIAYLISKYISEKTLKLIYWSLYILPLFFLVLGLSGVFNIFQGLSSNEGKYIEKRIENGQLVEDDLSSDTRTFIYAEVIKSALKHGYILWGRTPARGNDSASFGVHIAEELKTGKYERHENEVCFLNIFTWTGLIGMIFYCLIYLKSSFLAVYKSRNVFLKLVGVFIAFRFLYGWVEDFNRFDIMNISLWMMLSMGYSEKFRNMSNNEFKVWLKSIF